ncbi:hypothetical protein B0H16DRAFT_1779053 [Mycena metata]|uniref:F-box domain-containing protein n=1 Tax=Mycena metata TaxID=1033252 RepID=A0AAD7JPU8_9AGAR|nr:hypothetical protein B0H16DRAFT_1779053 [Mycena metata]
MRRLLIRTYTSRLFSSTTPLAPEMPLGFTSLPAELLDGIASHVPVTDLLALCRTNQGLCDVSLRWIYHTLSPTTVVCAVKLFKVLASNQAVAAYVRILVIHLQFDELLKSFIRLMRMALLNLTSLISLKSSSSSFSTVLPFFARTRFPRLRNCQIPSCADTLVFLRLHPTLLPLLRDFCGPASLACEVVLHSPIELVTLSWDRSFDHKQKYHNVLGVFSRMPEPLRVMSNVVNAWDPALLLAIAKHLPHLTVLAIRKLFTADPGEGTLKDFYDALKTAILGLPRLLAISCTQVRGEAPSATDLALEFSVVRELGSRSATLQVCTFASNTTWCRVNTNVWYPSAANQSLAESEWRVRWLVRSAVETPAEFPGYAEEMEKGVGKVAWAAIIDDLSPSAE